MRPALFLDVDGVCNGWADNPSDLHPEWPEMFCRVPGITEFFLWAREHFDVFWLTSKMLGGGSLRERPDDVEPFAWLLGVDPALLLDVPAAPWFEDKTEGIQAVIGESDRDWVWLDDDRMASEMLWLSRTGNLSRFLHVDCYKNIHALERALPVLAERFGLPLPRSGDMTS